MKELVFLLEEPSAKAMLESLLPRILSEGIVFRCIACKELEAFYLADLYAVEKALSLTGLIKHQNSRKFRVPDLLGSPSRELRTLTKQVYEKVAGSRAIGHHLDIENDRSPSFRNLILAIRRQEHELLFETA